MSNFDILIASLLKGEKIPIEILRDAWEEAGNPRIEEVGEAENWGLKWCKVDDTPWYRLRREGDDKHLKDNYGCLGAILSTSLSSELAILTWVYTPNHEILVTKGNPHFSSHKEAQDFVLKEWINFWLQGRTWMPTDEELKNAKARR